VSYYRIYPIDRDGRIVARLYVRCRSDEEAALLAVRMLANGTHAEVWVGSRCVGDIFTPKDTRKVDLVRPNFTNRPYPASPRSRLALERLIAIGRSLMVLPHRQQVRADVGRIKEPV
jgi:hypothetical protein